MITFWSLIVSTTLVCAHFHDDVNKLSKSSEDLLSGSKNNHHFMVRRDLSNANNGKCKDTLDTDAEKKIVRHPFPMKNDRDVDLQLFFIGENSESQLLLTTIRGQSFIGFLLNHNSGSKLYQSVDSGRTFQRIDEKINSTSIRSSYGIQKSPIDHNWVILVSSTKPMSSSPFSLTADNSFLLISKDGCKNFTSVKTPFKLRSNEPLLFNPKKKNVIIGLEERRTVSHFGKVSIYGQAFISNDFGQTWDVMLKGYVAANVKWGAANGKEGDEIYIATHAKPKGGSFFSIFDTFSSSSNLILWRSSDGGKSFEKIIEHCFNFGVEGDFVFASVVFNVSSGSHANYRRILHLSKDSGSNFHQVHVPEITPDRFYAVVEMHKGMLFLHIDEPGDTGKGTLFISGADGLTYTKSLDNHFYTNTRYTDFTRIDSMQGVYITQVLTNDNTLKSVITFDRGVTWQPLYLDSHKYCNKTVECSLHFHKTYSNVKQHTDIQGPLSTKSAPGIIFIHGQAGDALTGTARVWFSNNGGYNWTKLFDNPHHYAIGDSGNLLVVVPRLNNTGNVLKYSIDQGRCWHEFKFQDGNQEIVISGLATEPHAKDRKFSLWGFYKNTLGREKEWMVITIDFHGLFKKQCESSDLEEWSPHVLNKKSGCFLGEKLFYARPKLDAICYLGKDFKPSLRHTKCACTSDDLECDYGYDRQVDGMCKENKTIKPIEVCKHGEKMRERYSKGYRRVPGDICESKDASDDKVKYIDEKKKCELIDEKIKVFGVVKEEKKLAEDLKKTVQEKHDKEIDVSVKQSYKVKPNRKQHKGNTFFVVIGVLAVVLVVVGGGWYGLNVIRKRRYVKPTYVMSDLLDDDEPNGDTFDPRPKTHRQYRDESDQEDEEMLAV